MSLKCLEMVSGAAGADEAGRGPLAGPVVAAAVLLPDGFDPTGLDDSKKLTAVQRAILFDRICAGATYAIEFAEVEEVDSLNVLWASMAAMRRAVIRLSPSPISVLIDGDKVPRDMPFPTKAVVRGDGKYACIAAASILAKTTRDRLMVTLSAQYPGYGFDKHFGYPTPEHLAALREHGPCPIHRRTFGPVREMLEQPCLSLGD